MKKVIFLCYSVISLQSIFGQQNSYDTLDKLILQPYNYSFTYNHYQGEIQYQNVKFSFDGHLLKTGDFKGKLILGKDYVHMKGVFKAYDYYKFIPNKNYLTTLYNSYDSSINANLYFDGFYSLSPGIGTFNIKNRSYKINVFNVINIWSRPGIDHFTNQYFIHYLKFMTNDGLADNKMPIQINALSYATWYKTEILRENIVVKSVDNNIINNKSSYNEALLNLTEKTLSKISYTNFSTINNWNYEINGVSVFTKDIIPSKISSSYLVDVLVPKEYAINMMIDVTAEFRVNNKLISKKINTKVDKIDLQNNVIAFIKPFALPQGVDKNTYSRFKLEVYRTANTASIPIRVILNKSK